MNNEPNNESSKLDTNNTMNKKARAIAFYLPQFHPTPENDEWWGKGFTEWTNTAKAKPLYRDHYQPHVPADLGFYDLRVPETRIAQAEMAKEYGIEGFCYYHYWFAGKRIIERPFNEVLESGDPDFPFCLCWANQTWTGIWHGEPNRILIEQTYPGWDDYEANFNEMLKAFLDPRYLTVDGKPILVIYRPTEIENLAEVADFWQDLAVKAGLPGLYLIGMKHDDNWVPEPHHFNAAILEKAPRKIKRVPWRYPLRKIEQMIKGHQLTIYDYEYAMNHMLRKGKVDYLEFPCAFPNWDNSPRSGLNSLIFRGSTPELFREHFRQAIDIVAENPPEQRLVFIKAWNEWAEGNHLEPDLKYGTQYLEALSDELRAD